MSAAVVWFFCFAVREGRFFPFTPVFRPRFVTDGDESYLLVGASGCGRLTAVRVWLLENHSTEQRRPDVSLSFHLVMVYEETDTFQLYTVLCLKGMRSQIEGVRCEPGTDLLVHHVADDTRTDDCKSAVIASSGAHVFVTECDPGGL